MQRTIRWAHGYLTGMARAHRRGNVTERAVCGAIGLALGRGVEPGMVTQILAQHGLTWERHGARLFAVHRAPDAK